MAHSPQLRRSQNGRFATASIRNRFAGFSFKLQQTTSRHKHAANLPYPMHTLEALANFRAGHTWIPSKDHGACKTSLQGTIGPCPSTQYKTIAHPEPSLILMIAQLGFGFQQNHLEQIYDKHCLPSCRAPFSQAGHCFQPRLKHGQICTNVKAFPDQVALFRSRVGCVRILYFGFFACIMLRNAWNCPSFFVFFEWLPDHHV